MAVYHLPTAKTFFDVEGPCPEKGEDPGSTPGWRITFLYLYNLNYKNGDTKGFS